MPVVPRYTQPRVAPQALPGVRISPNAPTSAFGSPELTDLSGVSRVISQVAAEEKQKADQVAGLEADNQLHQLQTDLTTRALQRKGKDALGATEEATAEWRKRVGEIEQGMTNDTQRRSLAGFAQQRYQSLYDTVERHAASEHEAYDDGETKTAVSNRLSDAAENYGDPAKVAHSAAETRAIIADYAKRRGLGPEARKAATEGAISSLHTGVVNAMLADGQDLGAKDYIAAHRAEFNGDDLTRVDAAMREGSVRGESQRQAERIMGLGLTRADALAEARKVEDPDVQDMTVTRVKQRFQEDDQAAREQEEAGLTEATNTIERTGSVDSVPPALWATFSAGQRSGLRSYAKQLASGAPVETDWQTYYDLKSLASSPATRDKFAETNLLSDRAKLGDTEFKELAGLQGSVRKGDAKTAETQLAGFRTNKQVVDDNLNAAGIDPTPKVGSSTAKRVAEFRRRVDTAVDEIQQRTGKKATADEVQGVVDNLLVNSVVKGSGVLGFFQTERHAFELQPGETPEVAPEDIPRAERAMIEAALRRRGLPVTDDRIVALYQQRLQQMTGAPQ